MGNPHVVLFGAAVDDDTVRGVGDASVAPYPGAPTSNSCGPVPSPASSSCGCGNAAWARRSPAGQGACAAAAAAHDQGDAGRRVRVHNPGGPLDVELCAEGISLAGPTQRVGEVVVDEAVLAALVAALGGADGARAVPGAPEVAATP